MSILPGHNVQTCPCVGCRVVRGEKPNPHKNRKGSRSRSYLWLSDALDSAVSTLAAAQQMSKAALVRLAIVSHLHSHGIAVNEHGEPQALPEELETAP